MPNICCGHFSVPNICCGPQVSVSRLIVDRSVCPMFVVDWSVCQMFVVKDRSVCPIFAVERSVCPMLVVNRSVFLCHFLCGLFNVPLFLNIPWLYCIYVKHGRLNIDGFKSEELKEIVSHIC